jgi:hypothetical protein
MDQYLNTRSLSAATILMMVASVGERRYVRAALWSLFTAAIHPLMFVFGISFVFIFCIVRMLSESAAELDTAIVPSRMAVAQGTLVSLLLPIGFFPPMSLNYHEALQTRGYFFLSHWAWYELVGLVAPFAIFWWFGRIAKDRQLREFGVLCKALNIFGLIFALASLLTIPAAFERFTLLQPMRYLHLTYILLFILSGGLLAQFVLKRHVWRWLVLFVPLCAGMAYAQCRLFPATPHVELPGVLSPNPWVQAFLWIKQNTPVNAYFALDPDTMKVVGEDQHGFRALSERSMLADNVKDSGAVTMFPQMVGAWQEQTKAQAGWENFRKADFERLKDTYGVRWVVIEKAASAGMTCPYENVELRVCSLD